MIKSLVLFIVGLLVIYFILYPLLSSLIDAIMYIPNKIFGNPYDIDVEARKSVEIDSTKLEDKLRDFEFNEQVWGVDYSRIVDNLNASPIAGKWDRTNSTKYANLTMTAMEIKNGDNKRKNDKFIQSEQFDQLCNQLDLDDTIVEDQAEIVQSEIDSGVKQKLSKTTYRRSHWKLASGV